MLSELDSKKDSTEIDLDLSRPVKLVAILVKPSSAKPRGDSRLACFFCAVLSVSRRFPADCATGLLVTTNKMMNEHVWGVRLCMSVVKLKRDPACDKMCFFDPRSRLFCRI